MRSREYYWSLFHSKEKNQLDNLRTDQVEAVFAALPKQMIPEWWIWRDGFEAWKPLADFPQLLVSLRKVDDRSAELPPPPPNVGKTAAAAAPVSGPRAPESAKMVVAAADEPSSIDDLSLLKSGLPEDRSNYRFDRELEIRIMAGTKTYKNTTVNISMRGMQLKDPLPPDLPRYFNVEIRHKDRVIPVVCTEVRKDDGSFSNRLKIEVNDYSPGLLSMLLAG